MIEKEPLDNIVEFEVNGIKCGYDGVLVWHKNEKGEEECIGSFEDIKLLEKTSHCAIFYSECLDKYMDGYLTFDGKTFGNINEIHFDIIPIHHEENLPQLPEMWEQVRVIIDGYDIINQIEAEDDHHWGIESLYFLAQEGEYYKGKLLIGICTCTCPGCDDIVADVEESGNYITWKVYHDRNHDMNQIFAFDKKKYKEAIEAGKNRISQKM